MSQPWAAQVEVSPELALSLVREQFPELDARTVERFGSGWDNTAFLVNGELVFRFPHRESTLTLLMREYRVLPRLAPRLPLPIPLPRWRGRATERFPWAFTGYRHLAGTPADLAELTDDERAAAAEPLGAFLRALHDAPVDELDLPPDEIGRTAFGPRLPELVERLDQLRSRGVIDDPAPWLRLFEGELPAPPPRPAAVHGDLYVRHLLMDEARRVAGVIDWGDVHAGDPGVDLKVAYGFFPPRAREAFFRAYGPVDERTLRVARLRTAFHAPAIAWFADSHGDQALLRDSLRSMHWALEA